MEECDIAAWVQKAPDAAQRELRQAVHTVLVAIGRSSDLQPHMIIKGASFSRFGTRVRDIRGTLISQQPNDSLNLIRRPFVRSLKAGLQWRSRSSTTE